MWKKIKIPGLFILILTIFLGINKGYADCVQPYLHAWNWAEGNTTEPNGSAMSSKGIPPGSPIYTHTFKTSNTSGNNGYIVKFSDNWTHRYNEVGTYHNEVRNVCDSGADGQFQNYDSKYYIFNCECIEWGTCKRQAWVGPFDSVPVGISAVSNPGFTPGVNAEITLTLSATPCSQEAFYVRYSTDGWTTPHTVQATGSGTTRTATIPGSHLSSSETICSYYAFSSHNSISFSSDKGSDTDYLTANYNNNNGSNYILGVIPNSDSVNLNFNIMTVLELDIVQSTVTFGIIDPGVSSAVPSALNVNISANVDKVNIKGQITGDAGYTWAASTSPADTQLALAVGPSGSKVAVSTTEVIIQGNITPTNQVYDTELIAGSNAAAGTEKTATLKLIVSQ